MFVWDINKELLNFEKHSVSFIEATTVFLDPEEPNLETSKHKTLELKSIRLGISVLDKVIVVVYTTSITKDGKETIRFISTRQASRKERKA